MGKFKDKHGKTFMGMLVSKIPDVGGEVLKIAGTLTGYDSLTKLGNALGSDSTVSEEDKEEIMALAELQLQYDIIEAQEITKRWDVDAKSDSWLARNIRPLIVGWLVMFVSCIIVADSIESINFKVDKLYIALLGSLLTTVIVAYFGSRGFEKFNKIRANWKIKNAK